ncbi:MAG TPA: chemotaxis protein CheD [bacterium]|nr:chemotaxis protein CheD [bacterium]HPN31650.1 chemotaxis protein CheD [bacterium]
MKKYINVNTGEAAYGGKDCVLICNGIGSCIAAAAIDEKNFFGYLAHIMLPGKAPENYDSLKTKYAENAIERLIELMNENQTDLKTVKFNLIGAGNVLKKKDDTICEANINSTLEILAKRKLNIGQKILGGESRRAVKIDPGTNKIFYSEAGGEYLELV